MNARPIAAVVLAAGTSSRMGRNKLLIELEGETLLRRSVTAALGARVTTVIVVLGHEAAKGKAALAGMDVRCVINDNHASGLSTSLRAGLAAVPDDCDGAVVCLADMPDVDGPVIDRLIAAFDPAAGASIVAPRRDGRRGNPVLWGRQHFPALLELTGDQGARTLLDAAGDTVRWIDTANDAIFVDLDTPATLRDWLAEKGMPA